MQLKDIIDKLISDELSLGKNIPNLTVASNDTKAQLAYQELKKYYLFDEKERVLLEKITGCDTFLFTLMQPRIEGQFTKNAIDYQALLTAEIAHRTTFNNQRWFWQSEKPTAELITQCQYLATHPQLPLTNSFQTLSQAFIYGIDQKITAINTHNANSIFRKRTDHLTIATEFIQYHHGARQNLIHTLTTQLTLGQVTRPAQRVFLDRIGRLWKGLWGTNKDLSDLAKAHKQKTKRYEIILANIALPASRIASDLYENKPLVTHVKLNKNGIETPTKALIQMNQIAGQAYTNYINLIKKTPLPQFLQDDISIINMIINLKNTLLSQDFTDLNQQPDSINKVINFINNLDANHPFFGNLQNLDFLENLNMLRTFFVKFQHHPENITNEEITATQRQITQTIEFIDNLKVTEVLPSTHQQANESNYITRYRQETNGAEKRIWATETFKQLVDGQIPFLGNLTTERCIKNYFLMKPSAEYPRDRFSISVLDAVVNYRNSIIERYANNNLLRDKEALVPNQVDQNYLVLLKDLCDVTNSNRLVCASDLRTLLTTTNQKQVELGSNTLNSVVLTASESVNTSYNLIRESVEKQIDYLDVYIPRLERCSTILGNVNSAPAEVTAINNFIDLHVPKADIANNNAANLTAYIDHLKVERSYMNTVMYEALKVKQAAKFISGQLSYLLNNDELAEMRQRTR